MACPLKPKKDTPMGCGTATVPLEGLDENFCIVIPAGTRRETMNPSFPPTLGLREIKTKSTHTQANLPWLKEFLFKQNTHTHKRTQPSQKTKGTSQPTSHNPRRRVRAPQHAAKVQVPLVLADHGHILSCFEPNILSNSLDLARGKDPTNHIPL